MNRFAAGTILFLALAAGFTGGVWWFAYSSALDQLAERGRSDLALASDRLVSQLQQYRELAVLMADHPTLAAVLEGQVPARSIEALLLRTADMTGTLELYLRDAAGNVVARSNRSNRVSPVVRTDDPSFARAMQGALGAHHARVGPGNARSFVFSAPVLGGAPRPLGAVTVLVSVVAVEQAWVGDSQAIYFLDEAGVVFISNRDELLLHERGEAGANALARFGYDPVHLAAFPSVTSRDHGGHDVWSIDGGRYLPERALHLTRPLPVIGMTGAILLDVAPAERIAMLQAAVAGALMTIFGATLLLLFQRRRALADRLAIEARANAVLENRVAARTAELSTANRDLTREVAERKEAETALKRAQQDLVQAGKLSALGKMSAGLSHELNQPLMAIRSFAENGALLLERGAPDKAAQNLARIAELSRRMGRIIRNLRAFARQESEPMTDVDLVAVIDAVLEMSEARLRACDVDIGWTRPRAPVLVRGGEVRLQQVVLNLVTNALDAMAETPDKRLELSLERAHDVVRLSVRDTGPGIAEPGKIFDPFYSTKEVGQSEGMGLGLSISYGLVQSFGGAIKGHDHPQGGAVFTVELAAVGQGVAA